MGVKILRLTIKSEGLAFLLMHRKVCKAIQGTVINVNPIYFPEETGRICEKSGKTLSPIQYGSLLVKSNKERDEMT